MKDFVHTGFHKPTFTTVDDPALRAIEVDNGLNWFICFYVGRKLIDYIDLEHPFGSQLHSGVLDIPVLDLDGDFLGSVRDRIAYSLSLNDIVEFANLL